MAVIGEFAADRPIGADDVILGPIDQMEDHCAALDMAKEAGAEPGAFAGPLDQPRQVREHELCIIEPHHPELGMQCGERVVGDFRPGVRQAGKQRRFASIGQADETGIGDQFQPQPDPQLLAGPPRIGAARRLVGRALEMCVAEAAIAAAQQHDTLARAGEIGKHGFLVVLHDLRPDRHPQHEVATLGAGAVSPGASTPVLRPEMLPVTVIDQRVEIIESMENDVAALAALAAIGSAEFDEFLAAEAHRAPPAITALQVDLALVEEFHGLVDGKEKGEQPGRPPPFRSTRGTATRRLPPADRQLAAGPPK